MDDERALKGTDDQDVETTVVVDGGRIVVYDSPEELERLRAALDEQDILGVFVFVSRTRLQNTMIVDRSDRTGMPVLR